MKKILDSYRMIKQYQYTNKKSREKCGDLVPGTINFELQVKKKSGATTHDGYVTPSKMDDPFSILDSLYD